MPNDSFYILHAIALAERGIYSVHDNPRVGCVIVKEDQIVGEGWHALAGESHAEIIALKQAGENARGATCYITLEPCVHQGKTGPCTPALIQAGIKRVVIATEDPNPQVNEKGVADLRSAGIEVEVGVEAQSAYALNKGFFKRMVLHKPYVRVKLAMSLDGRIALANGISQWITSKDARRDVQFWRARSCAILTSSQTVLDDNPQMTVRDENVLAEIKTLTGQDLKQPRRVVIDTHLRTSPENKIYQVPGDVSVLTTETTPSAAWQQAGIKIIRLPEKKQHVDLHAVMDWLADQHFNEVWVEAGAGLAGALSDANLVDEFIIYVAPKFLGPDAKPLLQLPEIKELPQANNLEFVDYTKIGEDLRFTARVRCSPGLFKQ